MTDINVGLAEIVLTPLLSSDVEGSDYYKNYLIANYQLIISCLMRRCYEEDKLFIKGLVTSRANIQKIFLGLNIEELVFVQKAHMLIGFFTYSRDSEGLLKVKYYESPTVCRIAIINLIEASAFYLQHTSLIFNSVIFYAHQSVIKFKLQNIFNHITYNEQDNLYVMYTTKEEVSKIKLETISTINTYRIEKV